MFPWRFFKFSKTILKECPHTSWAPYFMFSPICEVEKQKKINFGLKGGFINFSKW
jgi:hypothetical protein